MLLQKRLLDLDKALELILNNLKKSTNVTVLELIERVCNLSLNINSYALIKPSFLFYLQTLFAFKESNKCIQTCKTFKAICRWFSDLKSEMFCYELLGRCCQNKT